MEIIVFIVVVGIFFVSVMASITISDVFANKAHKSISKGELDKLSATIAELQEAQESILRKLR